MAVQKFIGKTLRDLTKDTHIFWYPVRVFLLKDKSDNTGQFLMSSFSVAQVIDKFPAAADAVIAYADDYYGETVLRIQFPEGVEESMAEAHFFRAP